MITAEQHAALRAKLATYDAWAAQFKQRNGWTVIPADAVPPVKVTNDERSAVEVFELCRDKPDAFLAYVSAEGGSWRIATWTGEKLSADLIAGASYRNPRPSHTSRTLTPIRVKSIWGDWYMGRALGAGIYVRLRKTKRRAA